MVATPATPPALTYRGGPLIGAVQLEWSNAAQACLIVTSYSKEAGHPGVMGTIVWHKAVKPVDKRTY